MAIGIDPCAHQQLSQAKWDGAPIWLWHRSEHGDQSPLAWSGLWASIRAVPFPLKVTSCAAPAGKRSLMRRFIGTTDMRAFAPDGARDAGALEVALPSDSSAGVAYTHAL